jgi:hypothetical protein
LEGSGGAGIVAGCVGGEHEVGRITEEAVGQTGAAQATGGADFAVPGGSVSVVVVYANRVAEVVDRPEEEIRQAAGANSRSGASRTATSAGVAGEGRGVFEGPGGTVGVAKIVNGIQKI